MERFERRGYIVHFISEPRKEDPEEVREVVTQALYGQNPGGVIINPLDRSKRETFSSKNLRSVKDATPDEIRKYLATVALKIISAAQNASVFEFPTSS